MFPKPKVSLDETLSLKFPSGDFSKLLYPGKKAET